MKCSKLGKTWIITDAGCGMVRNTGFCGQNLSPHVYLAAGAFLAGDFLLGGRAGNSFGQLMQGVAAILFVPYFLSLLYVFGVQAKFVNPVKATIRYSFFVAMRNMKTTIQLAILMILFVLVNTTTLLANFLTLIYGIGLMGYFFGMYYKHTFAKYIEAAEEDSADEEQEH